MTSHWKTGDEKLVGELTHFASGIVHYAAVFGISTSEIAAIKADAAYFAWTIDKLNKIDAYKKSWTKYKNVLRKGEIDEVIIAAAPVFPVFEAAPEGVASGILDRFKAMVNRIKSHPEYNSEIEKKIGMQHLSSRTLQPEKAQQLLKVIMRDSKVSLVWRKTKFPGIFVEKDSGNGFMMHDLVFSRNYVDNSPIPPGQNVTWKYRAIYLSGNDKVGEWSPVVSINLAG